MRTFLFFILAATWLVFWPAVAAADPQPAVASGDSDGQKPRVLPIVIEVDGRAPREAGIDDLTGTDPAARARDRALDKPAFSTVIDIADRAGEVTSVGEALAAAGAHVRSLGGLGAFSSVSVRGNDPGHTAVAIDGVPLSTLASVTANLGALDLFGFSAATLSRSGGGLGAGGMGGAVLLTTRVFPAEPGGAGVYVSAGAGSFGARHLRSRWIGATEDGHRGWHVALSYAGADGDFSYFDDNGTNLNLADDHIAVRENNGYDQLTAVARGGAKTAASTVVGGVRVMTRRQGVPGPAGTSATAASLDSTRAMVDTTWRTESPFGWPAASEVTAYVVGEHQAYRDPLGEIGLSAQDRRYVTVAAGTHGRLQVAITDRHELVLGGGGRADYFADTSAATSATRGHGARMAGFLALADRFTAAGDTVELSPGLRITAMRTDPLGDAQSPLGEMDLSPRGDVFLSPRLGARVRPLSYLAIKANAGYYARPPTVYEMFGDRGFLVGNPGLLAETGPAADAGVVLAPDHALGHVLDRALVSAAGFVSAPHDAIVLVPTAGLATVPQNIGDAIIFGTELGATTRLFGHVTVAARYTFIDSRQRSTVPSYDGKRLPRRPRHHLYTRIDAATRWRRRLWVAWADADLAAGNFLDPANLSRSPPRHLFSAGLKIELVPGLLAALEVKNLTGERTEMMTLDPAPRPDLSQVPRAVADVAGYPLPGRAFYATLEWRPR